MRSVAKRIGIRHSYLSRLERGENAPLSEERIRALAVLFGDDPELVPVFLTTSPISEHPIKINIERLAYLLILGMT